MGRGGERLGGEAGMGRGEAMAGCILHHDDRRAGGVTEEGDEGEARESGRGKTGKRMGSGLVFMNYLHYQA